MSTTRTAAFAAMLSSLVPPALRTGNRGDESGAALLAPLLTTFLEQIPFGFIIGESTAKHESGSLDYRYVAVNPAYERLRGVSMGELAGRSAISVDGDSPAVIESYMGVVQTGEPCAFDQRFESTGRDCRVEVFRLDERHFAAVLTDVTEKRRADEELRASELRLRNISEAAQDAILMMDHKGRITFYNRMAEKTFGWSAAEVMGKILHDLLAPRKYVEIYTAAIEHFKCTGEGGAVGHTRELTALHKEGREFPIEISLSAIRVGDDWHAIGVIRDISSRKQAEETLRASEEKFRQIVDNIGIGVMLISTDFHILELNRQMREWYPEVRVEEHPHCAALFRNQEEDGSCVSCPTKRTFQDGNVHEGTVNWHRGDGKRQYRIVSSPVHDIDGRVIAAIEVLDDVTERLHLESELQQAQKLEAVGLLAAGIAHEINTPTQYVGDNVEFLQSAYESYAKLVEILRCIVTTSDDPAGLDAQIEKARDLIETSNLDYLTEQVPRALEQSLDGVGRIATIVQAMKEFSHPGTTEMTYADLNQCILSTITVSRNEWKYVAEVDTDLDMALPDVKCLPGELNQVFLNIIVNAAHAISDVVEQHGGEKGRIFIRTQCTGTHVEVSIGDTGTGIPEKIVDRIFDPFFTTKEVGKGTGQGLSIARNVVVDKHGGTLSVISESGKGATFLISIPIDG